MRNPTLHLIGITSSPSVGDNSIGGTSVFNTNRAEEELRHWLETRLDALGIDPVAYSRFVLSLLRRPDSALTPTEIIIGKASSRRSRRYQQTQQQEEREQKRAVIQCLTSAAEHSCGVESLVDELCERLENLSKINEEVEEPIVEIQTNLESLSPRDKAQRYFKAFPALRPTTPNKQNLTKTSDSATTTDALTESEESEILDIAREPNKVKPAKSVSYYSDKTSISKVGPNKSKNKKNKPKKCNKNNNNYSYNNNNNSTNKKDCMNNKVNQISKTHQNKFNNKPTSEIITELNSESISLEKEDSFGFVKSLEMQREQEQELYRQRLAQLEAKFDRSLEALWNNGSGNSSDRDSIWAAPNLSMPESSAWPTDTSLSNHNLSTSTDDSSGVGDDLITSISPLYPWEIDWTSPEIAYETALVENNYYNIPWSNSVGDNPWCWQSIGHNLSELNQSQQNNNNFFQTTRNKTVLVGHNNKESCQKKVNSLPEPEEDLLTSARTHFRPIKDDGNWADGTTFPINNTVERVAYRRSKSGNLLYLPGGDSPYMEFRPKPCLSPIVVSTNLTPKFRVRQCDKCVQTEPIWSPVKRKIISELDRRVCCNTKQALDNDDTSCESKIDSEFIGEENFTIDHAKDENQLHILQHNERKRRHSSSFKHNTLRELRPLTL